MKKSIPILSLIVICIMGFTACQPSLVRDYAGDYSPVVAEENVEPDYTLKMALWLPQELPEPIDWDPFDFMFNTWADTIEQESGGRIKIERYPGESLIKMGDMTDAIRKGLIDIAVIHPPAERDGRYPVSSLLALPNLFPNATVGSMVIQKLYEEGYYYNIYNSIHLLFRTTNYPSDIGCSTRPIQTLEDFQGLAIGVMDESEASALRALGAEPIKSPVTKQLTAIKNNLIDAAWLELHGQVSFQFYSYAKYFTKANGSVRILDLVMNLDTWNNLPADLQTIIEEKSGMEWSMMTGMRFDANYEKAIDFIREFLEQRDYPPIYYPPDEEVERWDEAWATVYEDRMEKTESLGIPGHRIIERTRELVTMYSDYVQ